MIAAAEAERASGPNEGSTSNEDSTSAESLTVSESTSSVTAMATGTVTVTVSEEQLLDVLYEVLAQGVDPKGELTIADVERFLHEHAREKKSLADMSAFFERHKLSTCPEDYAGDPELGRLASGLHRERVPTPPLDLPESGLRPVAGPMPETRRVPHAELVLPAPPRVPRVESVGKGSRFGERGALLRWAVLLLGLGLAFAFGFSYRRAADLEQKLKQAHLQQRTTDTALSALERRSESLHDALEQSEAARGDLSRRFDTFVTNETERRAADEVALQRLLGSRYEKLRRRALEAGAPRPSP